MEKGWSEITESKKKKMKMNKGMMMSDSVGGEEDWFDSDKICHCFTD